MGDFIVMSTETAVTLALSVIMILLGIIGYFLRSLHKDFRDVEKNLPEKYVRKDDFHRAIDDLKTDFKTATTEIKAMLGQMFAKLDGKQDKER